MNEFKPTDPSAKPAQQLKSAFAMMSVMHMALVSGVVLFGGVVWFQVRSRISMAPDFHNPLVLVACLVATGSLAASFVLNNIMFREGSAPSDALAAVKRYQVLVLIRAAVIEGGALASAVMALVTANVVPLGLLVLCALALVLRSPSQREFLTWMKRGDARR